MTITMPGLEIAGRVRAKDIQMAATADPIRRVLMISGAIDTNDYDIAVTFDLPLAGRWQVIKSETNLSDRPWLAWQMTCDPDCRFVDDAEAMMLSRQYAKTFVTPDSDRFVFYDGEVRPGEAVLKSFVIESTKKRVKLNHTRYTAPPNEDPAKTKSGIDRAVAHGMDMKPVLEIGVHVSSM